MESFRLKWPQSLEEFGVFFIQIEWLGSKNSPQSLSHKQAWLYGKYVGSGKYMSPTSLGIHREFPRNPVDRSLIITTKTRRLGSGRQNAQNIRAVVQHEVEQGFFSVPKQLMSTISFCIHILHDRWQVRDLTLTLTEDKQIEHSPSFLKVLGGLASRTWFIPILVVVKDHVPPSRTRRCVFFSFQVPPRSQSATAPNRWLCTPQRWFWKMMFQILWVRYILVVKGFPGRFWRRFQGNKRSGWYTGKVPGRRQRGFRKS